MINFCGCNFCSSPRLPPEPAIFLTIKVHTLRRCRQVSMSSRKQEVQQKKLSQVRPRGSGVQWIVLYICVCTHKYIYPYTFRYGFGQAKIFCCWQICETSCSQDSVVGSIEMERVCLRRKRVPFILG